MAASVAEFRLPRLARCEARLIQINVGEAPCR
jgi:hypothetical protein